MKVGDRANVRLLKNPRTVLPVTVVGKWGDTVTVRYDRAVADWTPVYRLRGNRAECTNAQAQKWRIVEDPNGRQEQFTWSADGYVHDNRVLRDGWECYRDF